MPINSKSGSRAAVDRGGKCVFGNLTMSLSSERSTAAGSAHPLVIVTDGSGHSSTSPPPRNPHTSQKKKLDGFSTALQGMKLLQKSVSEIPTQATASQIVLKTRICMKAQYGHGRVKTLLCPKCQLFRI